MEGQDDRRCIGCQDSTVSAAETGNSPGARRAMCSDLEDCMGIPPHQGHGTPQARQIARLVFVAQRRRNAHHAMLLSRTVSTSLHCPPTNNRQWWKLCRFALPPD